MTTHLINLFHCPDYIPHFVMFQFNGQSAQLLVHLAKYYGTYPPLTATTLSTLYPTVNTDSSLVTYSFCLQVDCAPCHGRAGMMKGTDIRGTEWGECFSAHRSYKYASPKKHSQDT